MEAIKMAAFSTSLSLYNPHSHTSFISSSRPSKHFPLQISQSILQGNLGITFSSFRASSSARKDGNYSIFVKSGYRNRGRSPSSSAYRESQFHPKNNENGFGPDDLREPEIVSDEKIGSALKPLVEVYKKAVFDGDEKAVLEVEEIIYMVEKEKNELVQKVSALSIELSAGKEKYARLQADFDNYRKRSEKERLTVRSNAQGEVIESLLPMIDSFERAKQQIKLETEKEKKIDTSYQGIYKQFVEIMRSLRVAAVPTIGKPFDPAMHEAIAREESEEFKEGIILQEIRRGFLLGDRLLRPATVKVSSGPGKKRSPSVPEQSYENPASVA